MPGTHRYIGNSNYAEFHSYGYEANQSHCAPAVVMFLHMPELYQSLDVVLYRTVTSPHPGSDSIQSGVRYGILAMTADLSASNVGNADPAFTA